jgi:hypothetical protein
VGKSLNGRQGAKSRTESENGYLSIPTFNLKLGSFSYFYSKNIQKKKKKREKETFFVFLSLFLLKGLVYFCNNSDYGLNELIYYAEINVVCINLFSALSFDTLF